MANNNTLYEEARQKANSRLGLKDEKEIDNETKNALEKKRKNQTMMFLLFLLATSFILYVFPKGVKFNYTYEIGKPWIHETLTSKLNFPIMKSTKEMQDDYFQTIQTKYSPYYSIDKNVGQSMVANYKRQMAEQGNSDTPETKYVIQKLEKIYGEGILASEEIERNKRLNIKGIKILHKDKNGIEAYDGQKLSNTHSIIEAYQQIMSNLPAGISKDKLQNSDINNYISANLKYEKETSDEMREELEKGISRTKGMVQEGERIIARGDIVTKEKAEILDSLKYEMEGHNGNSRSARVIIGQLLCIVCIIGAFYGYLYQFRQRFINFKNIFFLLSLICCMCAITSLVTNINAIHSVVTVYAIPFAIIPITVSTFFDTRTALFTHLTTILLCSLIAPHEFEFVMMQIIIGMICICTLKHLYQRSQLIMAVCIIMAVNLVLFAGITFTHNSVWSIKDSITSLSFLVNAMFLMFAYPLIFIIEKLFGYISDVTLIELTNTNSPLLRQFSEVAPGSFQHSMQVSNLAADAAQAVDCNQMLARAGAMYHDIGKMVNPIYFTENQKGFNPHTVLNEKESVQIIIHHVTDGISIANKNGLPKKIKDFIETHHGKNIVRYFYNTYVNNHPDEEVDLKDFSYDGKLPDTKETAIVMICDSVEAASRSLGVYTDASIDQLIDKITEMLLRGGSLKEAPLTLKEIEIIKDSLKAKLKNMYHTRVRYPELSELAKEKIIEKEKKEGKERSI